MSYTCKTALYIQFTFNVQWIEMSQEKLKKENSTWFCHYNVNFNTALKKNKPVISPCSKIYSL